MHQLRKNGTYRLIDPKTWRAGVYRSFKDTGHTEACLRTPEKSRSRGKNAPRAGSSQGKACKRDRPKLSAADYRRTPTEHSSSGKEDYGKGKKILKTLFKITVVILVIYFVIAFVRIFSVRHSTYDFDTEMKLASENYGEAVDAYFKDGKWKYNIFKNQVSYEGTSESGDDYVMIFGKNDGQTVVRQMTKNSKEVASDSIMNDVMGMFMFEKKVTG